MTNSEEPEQTRSEWLRSLRAVAFDIDGTIYSNLAMYRASLPIVLSHPRLFRAFGRARKLVRRYPPERDLRTATVEITARLMRRNRDFVAGMIDRVVYDDWERALEGVELYDDVVETLTALRTDGYRIAALSDFPVVTKLRRFGIADLWDCVLSSEETGYLKPHSVPFLRLAQMLDLAPHRILYVGNNYRYDVLGARAIGMKTAHITCRRRSSSKADVQFRRWSDLARILTVR